LITFQTRSPSISFRSSVDERGLGHHLGPVAHDLRGARGGSLEVPRLA
jgi:hypothetical protein